MTTNNEQRTTDDKWHMKNNPFKPLLIAGTLLVLAAVVFDPMLRGLLMPDWASAVGGYSASDLLGQLDEGGNPVYTTSAINNGGGAAPNAQGFGGSMGMAVDTTNHRLFVSDSSNNRVLVFNLDASDQLIDRSADLVLGQTDFATATADTTQGKFSYPDGLAYDATGNRLFVADYYNNRVMVFDVATIVDGENADRVLGQTDFVTGTGGTTQSKLSGPRGLAYDAVGSRLLVADQGNNRVMVFDVATITNGEPAVNELGQTAEGSCPGTGSFTLAVALTLQCIMNSPIHLAYDSSGNRLFVADQVNNRVMMFDVATIVDGENADRVLGQTDFVTGTGGTTESTLSAPAGLAYNSSGNRLFVADYYNNRVMVFDVASITNGEPATDVYGQTDFVTGTGGTTQSALSAPESSVWASSRLYVADTANNRLMIFNDATTPTPTPTPVGGNTYREVEFYPDRIVINSDESSTDSKNVLVSIYAHHGNNFTGTVDVLLSNTPDFSTTIPFHYIVGYPYPDNWPKTVSWDLCFGLPRGASCNLGQKNVYARFYVNTAAPQPAYTPIEGR